MWKVLTRNFGKLAFLQNCKSNWELHNLSKLVLDQFWKGIPNASVAHEVLGAPRYCGDYGQSLSPSILRSLKPENAMYVYIHINLYIYIYTYIYKYIYMYIYIYVYISFAIWRKFNTVCVMSTLWAKPISNTMGKAYLKVFKAWKCCVYIYIYPPGMRRCSDVSL